MQSSFDKQRLDARLQSAKRLYAIVVSSYAYQIAILIGFSVAGYVSPSVVVPFIFIPIAGNILVAIVLYSGLSRRFSDPTLFLPQQFVAMLSALVLALSAPGIAIQAFSMWIAIGFFGLVAPTFRAFLLTWGASVACVAATLYFRGENLTWPTTTLAGQALTFAVFFGTLCHAIGIAKLVNNLRRRVHEKNKALREALDRVQMLADQDELTGLPNRRSIMKRLEEQISLARRMEAPLTVALIDVDHFKSINDNFGHLIGDQVLQSLSKCVLGAIRRSDHFGRFGGEEFLIVLTATTLLESELPLERVRKGVAACDWSESTRNSRVSITIGAATYRSGETTEQLLKRADIALYRGKEGGRDRTVLENLPFHQSGGTAVAL